MGYNRRETEDSLREMKYDDIFATYLLLYRMKRPSEESETAPATKAPPSSLLRCDTTPVGSIGATVAQGLQGATSSSSTTNRLVHRAASTAATQSSSQRRPSHTSGEVTQAPPTNGTAASGRRATTGVSGASRSSSTSTEDHASPRTSVKDFNNGTSRGLTGKSGQSPSSPTTQGGEIQQGIVAANVLPVYGGDSKPGTAVKGSVRKTPSSGPSFRTGTRSGASMANPSTLSLCLFDNSLHAIAVINGEGRFFRTKS